MSQQLACDCCTERAWGTGSVERRRHLFAGVTDGFLYVVPLLIPHPFAGDSHNLVVLLPFYGGPTLHHVVVLFERLPFHEDTESAVSVRNLLNALEVGHRANVCHVPELPQPLRRIVRSVGLWGVDSLERYAFDPLGDVLCPSIPIGFQSRQRSYAVRWTDTSNTGYPFASG